MKTYSRSQNRLYGSQIYLFFQSYQKISDALRQACYVAIGELL